MNAKKRTKRRSSKTVPYYKRTRRKSSKKMKKIIKKPVSNVSKPSPGKPTIQKEVPRDTLALERWKEIEFLRSAISVEMPLENGTILSFKKDKKNFDKKIVNKKYIQIENQQFEGKYVCHDLYTKESDLRVHCFVPQEITGEKIKMIVMTQGTQGLHGWTRNSEKFAGTESFSENRALILSQINNLLKGLKKHHGVKEVELVMGGHSLGGADIQHLTVEIVNGIAVDFKHKKQLPPDKKVDIDTNHVSNFDMIKKIDTYTFNSAGVEKEKTNELETNIDFLNKQNCKVAKNISCNHMIYGGDPVQQTGYHLNPKPKFATTRVLKIHSKYEGQKDRIPFIATTLKGAKYGPAGMIFGAIISVANKIFAGVKGVGYHGDADVIKNLEIDSIDKDTKKPLYSIYANDVRGKKNKEHMDAIDKEVNNFNPTFQKKWIKLAREIGKLRLKKWSYRKQLIAGEKTAAARRYISAKDIEGYHNLLGEKTAKKFAELENIIATENKTNVLYKRIAYHQKVVNELWSKSVHSGNGLTTKEVVKLEKSQKKLKELKTQLKEPLKKLREWRIQRLNKDIKLKYTDRYISKAHKKFPEARKRIKYKHKERAIKSGITIINAMLRDAREAGADSNEIASLENDLKIWQQMLNKHIKEKHKIVREIIEYEDKEKLIKSIITTTEERLEYARNAGVDSNEIAKLEKNLRKLQQMLNVNAKKKHAIVREIRKKLNNYLQQQKKAKSKKNEVELIQDYMKSIELSPYAFERKVLEEELDKYKKILQIKKSTPATLNKQIKEKHKIARETIENEDYEKLIKSVITQTEERLEYARNAGADSNKIAKLENNLKKLQQMLNVNAKKKHPTATLNKKIRVAKANVIGYFGYFQRRKGSRYQHALDVMTKMIQEGHTVKLDPVSNKIKFHVNRKKHIDKKQKIETEMAVNDLNTYINGRWLTQSRKKDFLNNMQDFLLYTKEKAKTGRKQQVEIEKVSKKLRHR